MKAKLFSSTFEAKNTDRPDFVHCRSILRSHLIQIMSCQQVTCASSTLKFNLNEKTQKLCEEKADFKVILHLMESVMDEEEAANCGTYDATCDNEDKAGVIVLFHFFFAKPLLLFFTNIVLWKHDTSTPKVIVLRTIKAWLTCFQSRQTKGATELDSAHANDTFSVGISRRIDNDWQHISVFDIYMKVTSCIHCVIIGKKVWYCR